MLWITECKARKLGSVLKAQGVTPGCWKEPPLDEVEEIQ